MSNSCSVCQCVSLATAGAAGERGRRGTRGEPGIKGDAGLRGPKGHKGEPGVMSSTASRRPTGARVAFSVARSQKLGPVSEDTLVGFDVVFTNVGDRFDVSASRFVCRTNGTYTFSVHLLGQDNKDVYAWIMMNDKHKVINSASLTCRRSNVFSYICLFVGKLNQKVIDRDAVWLSDSGGL